MKRNVRSETIARILRSVGYLQQVGPKRRFGTRHIPVDVKTITEISKATGINQSRPRPIMRDLSDSQLIDVSLQETGFRKPVEDYRPPKPKYSMLRSEVPKPAKPRIPKGLNLSEEFEFRVRHAVINIPIPQRDFYLRFYRTELGQEWLDHYTKFPNSTKKLREIQERHRLTSLKKSRSESEPPSPNDLFEASIRELFGVNEPKSALPK